MEETRVKSSRRRCSVKKSVLKNFTGKNLCWSLFLIKLLARLQHRCFPMKFKKFLRTPIVKNICERLLLSSKKSLTSKINDTEERRVINDKKK